MSTASRCSQKGVPLTDLERKPANVRSTANLFGLPVGCHYGVGSPSCSVWRELAAHHMTTAWVLGGWCRAFPLSYHWRVLDRPAFAGSLPDELADVDAAVAYWHGADSVRRRLEAIAASSASVTLFLEYLPSPLPTWLHEHVADGAGAAPAALAMVERSLRRDVAAMNERGLLHFDAHLDNLLVDGRRVYSADFGLATSPLFDLSAEEAAFLAANASHDVCHTITRLVDWLVTTFRRTHRPASPGRLRPPLRAGRRASGPARLRRRRRGPLHAACRGRQRVLWRLFVESRATPYPADAARRACARAGIDVPTIPAIAVTPAR